LELELMSEEFSQLRNCGRAEVHRRAGSAPSWQCSEVAGPHGKAQIGTETATATAKMQTCNFFTLQLLHLLLLLQPSPTTCNYTTPCATNALHAKAAPLTTRP
jgi:hypothetical protein